MKDSIIREGGKSFNQILKKYKFISLMIDVFLVGNMRIVHSPNSWINTIVISFKEKKEGKDRGNY